MSSVGTVFLFLVMVLLSLVPPLLLAAVCFYACWYAVKNSPTRGVAAYVQLLICLPFEIWGTLPAKKHSFSAVASKKTKRTI